MFITSERSKPRGWYTRNGQRASGSFLMLFNEVPGGEIRAVVRHVKMNQCGHFMMGPVSLGGIDLTLSGCYGSDGLPIDIPEDNPARYQPKRMLWERLHTVPQEIAETMWKSTSGHNSSGDEGPAMRKWAEENVKTLRRLR